MRFSRVKAKLRRGEATLIVTCHFTDVQARYAPLGFTFDNRLAAAAAAMEKTS